jgi:hypothetical protein
MHLRPGFLTTGRISTMSTQQSTQLLSALRPLAAWMGIMALCTHMALTRSVPIKEFLTLIKIRYHNWSGLERQLLTAGSGIDALPRNIGAGISLLKTANATTYRLSPKIREDVFLRQRLEEVSWPIEFSATSHFMLRRLDEATSCRQLSTKEEMAIDHCD